MFFTANGQYTYNADKLPKVIAASQQAVELAMQVGADCVFCGVMPLAEHVDSFANIGKKYNAEVVVYCLKKQYESAHAIPLNIIETMMQKWQNYKGEIDS